MLGLPYTLYEVCLFVILVISLFGFEGKIFFGCDFPVPGHCLYFALFNSIP